MAKIPFDIKYRPQIESGEYKVKTRDEEPVEIVLWDWCGGFPYPILGRVGNNGDPFIWTRFGRLNLGNDPKEDTKYDLFITTEPELSELGSHLYSVFESVDCRDTNMTEEELTELARKQEKVILALARKELQPEIDAEVEKAYKNADRMQYEKGRDDALKETIDLTKKIRDAENAIRVTSLRGFESGRAAAFNSVISKLESMLYDKED